MMIMIMIRSYSWWCWCCLSIVHCLEMLKFIVEIQRGDIVVVFGDSVVHPGIQDKTCFFFVVLGPFFANNQIQVSSCLESPGTSPQWWRHHSCSATRSRRTPRDRDCDPRGSWDRMNGESWLCISKWQAPTSRWSKWCWPKKDQL